MLLLLHFLIIILISFSVYFKEIWAIILASILFIISGPKLGTASFFVYFGAAYLFNIWLDSFAESLSFIKKFLLICFIFMVIFFIDLRLKLFHESINPEVLDINYYTQTKINIFSVVEASFILFGWAVILFHRRNNHEEEIMDDDNSDSEE